LWGYWRNERGCDGRSIAQFRASGCLERVCLGKFTKAYFPNSDNRSARILDLAHTDVCGTMSHVSLSGRDYYITFNDDYSRNTWIYFLKTKSEVFKRFKDFKALVEN
jgi:hypothetical protein